VADPGDIFAPPGDRFAPPDPLQARELALDPTAVRLNARNDADKPIACPPLHLQIEQRSDTAPPQPASGPVATGRPARLYCE
jgi:hypothetical protein